MKQDQRARGRTRLIAASRARSAGSSLGCGVWRCRTASWWRSTRISSSLAASRRASRARSCVERHQGQGRRVSAAPRTASAAALRRRATIPEPPNEPAAHRPWHSFRTLRPEDDAEFAHQRFEVFSGEAFVCDHGFNSKRSYSVIELGGFRCADQPSLHPKASPTLRPVSAIVRSAKPVLHHHQQVLKFGLISGKQRQLYHVT